MKRILFILAILALSMTFGYFVIEYNGYVLIHVAKTKIEMTLAFAALMAVLVFGLMFVLLLIIKALLGSPWQISHWFSGRKKADARKKFFQGITFLAEGCYQEAEKKLLAEIKNSERPQLNYIGAAIAAHCQGQFSKSDEYFAKAAIGKNKPELAIGFVQSLLHTERGSNESAIAKLGHLNKIKPNHEPVILRLIENYENARDWQSLSAIVPLAKKRKMIDEKTAFDYEVKLNLSLLQTAENSGVDVLSSTWGQLPKIIKLNAEIIAQYAQGLISNGAPNEAEKVIRESLRKNWSSQLVELYGTIKTSQPEKMLAKTEDWLKTYPSDAQLLLAAGRLAERAQIWTRAKEYMQASIDIHPTKEALKTLGLLLEHLEGPEAAIDCYRMAVTL